MKAFSPYSQNNFLDARTFWILGMVIAAISLLPLMLPKMESWDFVAIEMGFIKQDTTYFDAFKAHHYIRYLMLLGINALSLASGIPHKVIVNILSVAAILGLSQQVYVFLRSRYSFDRLSASFGAWTILAFPVWHTLASGAVTAYILYFWAFMFAVNQWYKKRPIVALFFFLFSLSYYSIFAFSVGFAISEFILTVNNGNWRKKSLRTFAFCFLVSLGFVMLNTYGNIHEGGTYNTFNTGRLISFLGYAILASVTGLLTFLAIRRMESKEAKGMFIRYMLSFLTLAFFAGLAYWAVGKPLRFFAFGSYTARHTYLTSIPFALIVAIVTSLLRDRVSKKALMGIAAFFFTALLVLQHQGHSHKVANLVFREMVTQTFKRIEEPPSGYLAIASVSAKPPHHLHGPGLAMSLYRAYGKNAWMVNDFWAKRNVEPTLELIKPHFTNRTKQAMKLRLAEDVTGETYSKYHFVLTDYHQEGRFWYWWYYLTSDYSSFKPQMILVERQ